MCLEKINLYKRIKRRTREEVWKINGKKRESAKCYVRQVDTPVTRISMNV